MPITNTKKTSFKAIQHENMGDKVYSEIAAALMEGKIKPNDKLRIRELAASLGTSVTPVRDAILRLVQDGALTMRSPRDIRVAEIDLEQYLEIRDIRLKLEGMAAARAAENSTKTDIQKMKKLIERN